MTPEQWARVNEIFHSAVELDEEKRAAYLDEMCSGDEILRSEVESLLVANSDAEDFIRDPVVDLSELSTEIPTLAGSMFGHYRIERSIGRGGMGEVYLAVDTKLNRRVALKKLPDQFASDTGLVRRLENEARSAATLNHPNVATVYSVEEFEGKPFITMEYVDGKTLDELIPGGGLNIKVFFDWFIQLTEALCHAHERGITHRDIKPGNIMVTSEGVPKILDFGLAQISQTGPAAADLHDILTEPGKIMGTPSYMSPEQAEGKQIDNRSDIFSLGVVMYEALTGVRPFKGDSHAELVSNLLRSDPVPVADLRPDAPSLVARLIARCLEKSKSARIQTSREVHTILSEARAISGAGISSDSFLRRFYAESRQPSRLWLIPALVAVTVLSVGAWYYFSRERTPVFSVERLTMRQLSQSNDVALSVISPDGRSIAYVRYEKDDGRSLWLRLVSESNSIKLVDSQQVHYWDIAFSHDGDEVYFITAPRFGVHGTLFRVSSIGGQARRVTENINHLGNFSPDGKRVLFVRYGDPAPATSVNVTDSKLISANAENGGDEQVLRVLTGETIIRKSRFSPTGNTVFYVKRELDRTEHWSIIALDVASGNERVIVRQGFRIDTFAVLNSGEGLVMNAVDDVSNRRQLFYVPVEGGAVTRVTNDLNNYIGVSIDREGRNIVSVQRKDESRIWIGAADDPSSMVQLAMEQAAHLHVDWTPDGRIVYDAVSSDRLSVWSSDADGRNAMQLTPADSDNSSPRISGDGRYIVFTSRRAGYNQVWRMNADGSDQRLLADAPGITQAPQFAADGKTVVFRWYNEGSPPMGMVSIEGGEVRGIDYLPQAFNYFWAMSPDGRTLAFTKGGGENDPTKVIVRSLEGPSTETQLDIRPAWFLKWMPDGTSLYYQESQQGESLATKVFQIDPSEGRPKLLMSTEPDTIVDLTFSRDRSRFAAVRLKVLTDAVLISATSPER